MGGSNGSREGIAAGGNGNEVVSDEPTADDEPEQEDVDEPEQDDEDDWLFAFFEATALLIPPLAVGDELFDDMDESR